MCFGMGKWKWGIGMGKLGGWGDGGKVFRREVKGC